MTILKRCVYCGEQMNITYFDMCTVETKRTPWAAICPECHGRNVTSGLFRVLRFGTSFACSAFLAYSIFKDYLVITILASLIFCYFINGVFNYLYLMFYDLRKKSLFNP